MNRLGIQRGLSLLLLAGLSACLGRQTRNPYTQVRNPFAPTVRPTFQPTFQPNPNPQPNPQPQPVPIPQRPSEGLTIVSSNYVLPNARNELARILDGMAQVRTNIWNPYKTMPGFKIVIRGIYEQTQNLPDIMAFPWLRNWVIQVGGDARVGGGLGCNAAAPIVVVSEVNLLRLPGDAWYGESVALHELAHGFLTCVPPAGLRAQVEAAYATAVGQGKWANTYARTNPDEYWAEGVQDFFNCNLQSNTPNGIHNFVNTRVELQAYDPTLYNIIRGFFGDNPWTY